MEPTKPKQKKSLIALIAIIICIIVILTSFFLYNNYKKNEASETFQNQAVTYMEKMEKNYQKIVDIGSKVALLNVSDSGQTPEDTLKEIRTLQDKLSDRLALDTDWMDIKGQDQDVINSAEDVAEAYEALSQVIMKSIDEQADVTLFQTEYAKLNEDFAEEFNTLLETMADNEDLRRGLEDVSMITINIENHTTEEAQNPETTMATSETADSQFPVLLPEHYIPEQTITGSTMPELEDTYAYLVEYPEYGDVVMNSYWLQSSENNREFTRVDDYWYAETYLLEGDTLLHMSTAMDMNAYDIVGKEVVIQKAELGTTWKSSFEYQSNENIDESFDYQLVNYRVQKTSTYTRVEEVLLDGVTYTAMVVETKSNIKKDVNNVVKDSVEIREDWIVPGFGAVKTIIDRDGSIIVINLTL